MAKSFWQRLTEPVAGQGSRGMLMCPTCESMLESVPGLYTLDTTIAMCNHPLLICRKCFKGDINYG